MRGKVEFGDSRRKWSGRGRYEEERVEEGWLAQELGAGLSSEELSHPCGINSCGSTESRTTTPPAHYLTARCSDSEVVACTVPFGNHDGESSSHSLDPTCSIVAEARDLDACPYLSLRASNSLL